LLALTHLTLRSRLLITNDYLLRESYYYVNLNQTNYRRCVSCRKVAPKQSFWRIVRVSPSHEIALDRGMGRSAYLCPNLECLTQARRKNRLQGALRTKVKEEIYQSLQERLD